MSSTAALATTLDPLVIVTSDLLGEIDVAEDQILRFPAGLLGFPECQSFVLLPSERSGVYWLQSADHSALSFVLADPFVFFKGHSVDIGPGDLADLQAEDASEVVVLAIVTLPRSREQQATANLQGPLAFNLSAQRGKQLALQGDQGVQCPLDLMGTVEKG